MSTASVAVPEPILVRAGLSFRGEALNIYGSLIYPKLTGAQTGGKYAVMESTTPPGGGPPYHMHHREDEGFYVVEGQYLFEIGEQRIQARPGDFLLAPKDVPHCFQNIGKTTGTHVVIVEPAGLEVFFAEIAALDGRPDPAKVLPIFDKYGLELLGPPMGAR